MTRFSRPQVAFSSGEISPLLFGRSDYQRFQTGVRKMRGFIPLVEGGFTRAPGTLHRGGTKDNRPARLVNFEFAANDALTLEFTDYCMRVWRYGALVMDGGSPYELVTPYAEADLPNLQWVQSADVIYLVDGNKPVQKLARYALDSWTITDVVYNNGPFRVQNLNESKTVKCSAATGTITLTGVGDIFQAGHVGSLMRITPEEYENIPLWVGNASISVGDTVRYGTNIYKLKAGSNTGVNPPVHLSGTEKVSASPNVKWKFLSDGVGIVKITAVSGANSATAKVIKEIPSPCVDSATYRWSEGAWSDLYGYPAALEIYDQRFVAAATPSDPRTVWFSTVGAFEDHEPSVEADGAFAYAIGGRNSVNSILWLREGSRGLHIGALGEEWSVRALDTKQVVGPTNVRFGYDGSIGSIDVVPIAPDGNPIFISKDGARVFELNYSFEQDKNIPRELSRPSKHLGTEKFEEIVWQSAPQRLAWLRRGNGELAVLIYDQSEDTLGWAPYSLAGGIVESISVTTGPDGANDVLTMVVRREIDGSTVRFVEEQALVYGILTGEQPISKAVHYFACSKFEDVAETDVFNVPHLIGEEVRVWTNKGDYGPITVDATGDVQLPDTVTDAVIGLFDTTHQVETLDIQAAANDGDTRGRLERLHAGTGIILHQTAAGVVRTIERDLAQSERVGHAQQIIKTQVASDLSAAYSGTVALETTSGNANETALRFEPVGGAPMTVLALISPIEEAGA